MENFVVLTSEVINNEWLRVYVQDKNGRKEHSGSRMMRSGPSPIAGSS